MELLTPLVSNMNAIEHGLVIAGLPSFCALTAASFPVLISLIGIARPLSFQSVIVFLSFAVSGFHSKLFSIKVMQPQEQCKKSTQHKRNAEQYLKNIGHQYVLDESRGIYRPQSCVPEDQKRTSGSDKKRPLWTATVRDWPTLIISLFTLGLLWGTAYFTGRQWQTTNDTYWEIHKQTANTERFFRTDERAWLEFDPLKPSVLVSPVPIFGTIYKYELFPKNVGKTLARDIVIHIPESQNGPWDVGQSETSIRDTQDVLLTGNSKDQTGKQIVVENDPIPKALAPGASSPVPLMLHGPAPVHSGKTINYGYFIGRIDYVDAFNIPHWKKFCFVIYDSAGDVENCKYGNDEDSNSENP